MANAAALGASIAANNFADPAVLFVAGVEQAARDAGAEEAWLVDASDVPDPHQLALRTTVNGRVTQQGHTSDMIHDVASLIEYLSEFMTLRAGDVILTGTPEGVVNVDVGDEVVTEIEGVGRLVNTIVGDPTFSR